MNTILTTINISGKLSTEVTSSNIQTNIPETYWVLTGLHKEQMLVSTQIYTQTLINRTLRFNYNRLTLGLAYDNTKDRQKIFQNTTRLIHVNFVRATVQ